MHHRIEINRAPVLTMWAAVVAERLGFNWQEALTLGRAVAGFNAYSKGKAHMMWTASPQRHHSAKERSPERHKEGDRP